MRKFTVEGKPQRLGKYLGMVFPELGFAYFRQLLKTKNVRINERRVTEDVYVEKGDVIELFLEEEPLVPLFMGIIIGRCNDIVITVRTEAVHVCQNTVYFWNSKIDNYFSYSMNSVSTHLSWKINRRRNPKK